MQPPEVWSAAIAQNGLLRDTDHDASYVAPWANLYTRSDEPLPELVRRYDRSWWRMRRETDQLRDSLLAAHGRLAELEDQPGESRPELQAEIDRLSEEVLKLRDLLIGKDAELGAAKGKLAMYEDGRERLQNVKNRFGSVPGVGMLLHLFLRLVGRA